jgi:maltose alpha-D-glucosyltransferase/alpha-amylase
MYRSALWDATVGETRVAQYYGVNPRYGTLGDFVEFAHGCKQRGMRVLIDLVVNHTSNEHPWFHEARRDPKSKY